MSIVSIANVVPFCMQMERTACGNWAVIELIFVKVFQMSTSTYNALHLAAYWLNSRVFNWWVFGPSQPPPLYQISSVYVKERWSKIPTSIVSFQERSIELCCPSRSDIDTPTPKERRIIWEHNIWPGEIYRPGLIIYNIQLPNPVIIIIIIINKFI